MPFRLVSTATTAVVLGRTRRSATAGMAATGGLRMSTTEVSGRVWRGRIEVRAATGVTRARRGTAAMRRLVVGKLGTTAARGATMGSGTRMILARETMIFLGMIFRAGAAGVRTTDGTAMRPAEAMRGYYTVA